MLMTLTDYVGSLLRVFHHSSQPHRHMTFHVGKRADMHIRVGNGPCWPLLLPR
jgi:hypothetical protein